MSTNNKNNAKSQTGNNSKLQEKNNQKFIINLNPNKATGADIVKQSFVPPKSSIQESENSKNKNQ